MLPVCGQVQPGSYTHGGFKDVIERRAPSHGDALLKIQCGRSGNALAPLAIIKRAIFIMKLVVRAPHEKYDKDKLWKASR